MAIVESNEVVDLVDLPPYAVGFREMPEIVSFITQTVNTVGHYSNSSESKTFIDMSTVQFIEVYTVNKVWDSAVDGGSWVTWESADVDLEGESYPNQGNWGVSTSFFRTQAIIYSRNE